MSSARSASTIPERGSAARRHRFGRLVAVVAGAAMALTGVGLNAQAASAATAGVQKVADELAGVADSPAQAQAAAQAMKDLGLIDSKGNVREVSAKVGGRELRGQALKDWAKDAAVPDTAQATVDGKAVSKGDINKMVQIADATEELKKTYFTEHKVTSQQVDDLQSIVDQIKNGGIQVKPAAADVADAQARDLVVTTSNSVVLAAGASGAATFTLSATPTKAVSFEYQFIDGAATWGRDYTSADGKTGTITFPAGATGAALTQQIAVTALSNTTPSAVGGDNRWQGKRGFVLQLSSLDGARFDSATLGRTSTTVLGAVTGGNVDYQTMANAEFGGRLNVGDSGGTLTAYHGSIMLAPGQALPGISSMDLYHTDNSSALYDGEDSIDDAVSFTAEEISGTNPVAGQPMYPALDWSSATNMLRSYTAGVAPGMHVEQGANSGDNTTWEWYRVGLGYQFHFDSAAIASLQALEAEIGDITGIAFSPHLKRGGSYSSCPPLGLIVRLTDQNGNELYNGTGPEDLPSAILSLTSTVGSQFKAGSGNWTLQLFPVTSQLCVGNYGVITDDSAISMKVVDGQRAALTSVTAAPGTYVGGPNSAQTGAIVPLVVHFSEPVTNPSIVVRDGSAGGRGISPLESNTTATTFTFNYAVPNNPPSAISIQSWSAAELFGDEAGGTFDGATMSVGPSNGVNLVRGPVANAVTSVTTDKTQYGPAAETATVTVKIDATRPEFEDFAQELGAHDSVAQSLAYSVDGGATRRPLTYDEDASTDSVAVLTGTFDVPAVVSAQQKRVELYYTTAADPGASSARWVLAMGDDTYADFTIAAAIFFTEPSDLGIAEPAAGWDAEKRIVYAGGDQVPVVFGKNIVLTTATFQSDDDFAWSVETDGATDPPGVALATIDETGALRATGLGEGAIRVALTATNGGLADPVTVTTDPISVKVSSTPYISPPGTKGTVIGTQNQQLRLAWSSNATLLASKAETPYQAEYDVSVFPGDHTVDQMTAGGAGQAVWTDQTPDLAVTVPADTLSAISRSGVPAYSYLIATKNPDNPSRTLASGGGIVILAPAAAVDVSTDAGTRYLLDNHDPVHITWTMQHFDVANAADFTFSVSTPHGTVEGSDVKFVPGAGGADGTFQNPDGQEVGWATATGGTYTLDPVKLTSDDLDTVYTVEIKAKNASDSTYSYASTQLWVYDHTALDILVNGARPAGGKTVLSNRGWVQDAETRGQTALQDTVLSAYDNDQLSLKATISANYGEHAWKTVADQLGWASSDTSVATVNARRGAMYAPTSKDATYSPNTEFMLSGFGSGQTTITATHARTGMATSIDLSVDTLAGQLFLFQAYPRGTATMAYTDQKGASHSVTSDASGRFAIYSPDGVKGLVGFSETQGTGADAIEYRGTLHAEDLKSGEKDSAQMYTYPVNSIQLRSVAKLTLHFQKPDGQPYTGRVNLNGGVYTAGAYQPDSQLAPQGQDNLLTPDQYGAVTLTWDITRWGDVAHTATFDYAFEASFPGDDYLPMLVEASTTKSDAWEVDAASHVTVLRSAAGHKAGVPVTDSTTVTDQADGTQTEPVTDGRVGPTLDYPTIYLTSTFLWPGTSLTDAPKLSAQLFDQGTGQAPAGQSSKDITFPFSSMPVLRQTEKLDASTLWMDKLVVRPVSFSLFNGETAVATVAAPCGIVNGLEASVDGAGAAKDTAPEVTPNSASGQSPSNLDGAGIGNKFLGAAMGLVSNISVNTDAFKMMISPTDDPAVYKYVVQINVGTTPTDTGNTELDFDYAGRDTSNYRGIVTGVVPNPFDAYDMAKGRYSAKQQETLDAHKGKKTTHFGSALYKFDSFVEGKIYYDGTAGKWKSRLMGGFLQMGGGYEFTKAFNTMAGPVPVTFSLTAGAAVTFDLSWRTLEKQADPGGSGFNTAWLNPNQDSVMDMLTHFQAALYVDLFGGIGFDYEVVAFKIGVFGDLNINIHQYFLGRPYVAPKDVDAQGGSFKFTGTFGIRVDIKLFFFSLRFVIVQVGFSTPTASWGQWKNIGAYWKSITGQTLLENGVPVYSSAGARSLAKAKSTSELTADQIAAAKAYQQATGTSLGTDTVTVAQGSIENRDYLTQAKQVWASQTGGRHVRDAGSSGLTVYERNAYPNASPAIFNDGSGFLFLDDQGSSDITKTRVASYRSGQTSVIDDGGKGDSELTAAGGGSLAAAAWVRQTVDPSQDVAATGADQSASLANLAASAEVYAAVRQGDAWQTTALSANSVGDISPVVAVGGGKVLVAWQQVASSATDSAMTFDQLDRIVYRVYDVDSATWGPEIVAYNGTSGQVKGMAVALLPDGKTGSIVYTVQGDTAGDTADDATATSATLAALVDTAKPITADEAATGATGVTSTVQITDGQETITNPQLTVVTQQDQPLFLTGWHTSQTTTDENGVAQTTSDVRLYGFDEHGDPVALPDSLAAAGVQDDVMPNANFRFAHSIGSNPPLDQTAIVWSDAGTTDDSASGSTAASTTGSLKAVRLTRGADGQLSLAPPTTIATMPAGAVPDTFDAVTDGTAVQAVVVATRDWQESDGGTGGTETVTAADGTSVDLPVRVSLLGLAAGQFQNGISVTSVVPDYSYVHKGATMPIAFTVTNTGPTTIDSVAVAFKDSTTTGFSEQGASKADADLAPGASMTLTAFYDIPAAGIEDPEYQVTASYGAAPGGTTISTSDTIHLDVPEVAIASATTDRTTDGQRTYRVTLANGSDVPLAGSGRHVELTFADSAGAATDASGAATDPIPPVTITDDADLAKIDEGVYTVTGSFDTAAYVQGTLGKTELPNGGVDIEATVEVTDSDGDQLTEANRSNNYADLNFPSLIEMAGGETQRVTTGLDNTAGRGSEVALTVSNLSLQAVHDGNVQVTLLDAQGNPIATKVAIEGQAPRLSLAGESDAQLQVHFDQTGARAIARFFRDTPGQAATEPELAGLDLTGVNGIELAAGQTDYTGTATNLTATTLTARAASADATITVSAGSRTVATGTGAVAAAVPLALGTNPGDTEATVIDVTVVTASGASQRYQITVQNTYDAASAGLMLSVTSPMVDGWVKAGDRGAAVALAAGGESDQWAGVTVQVSVDDGAPVRADGFTGVSQTVALVQGEGEHTVTATATDSAGNEYPVEPLTLWVDQTAPTVTAATMTTTADPITAGQAADPSLAGFNPVLLAQTDRRVAVSWTAGDTASGLASCDILLGDKAVPVTPDAAGRCQTVLTDPFSGLVSARATDHVGRTTTVELGQVNLVAGAAPEQGKPAPETQVPGALPETLSAPTTSPVLVKISATALKVHPPRSASQIQYRIRVKGTSTWSAWQYSPTFRHLKPGKKYQLQLRRVLAGIAASVPSAITNVRMKVQVKFKSAQAGVKAKGLPKAKAVKVGAKLHKPKAPHAKGYSFKGWYTNKARTHKYNFHKKIKKTITLYAGWKQ